MNYAMATYVICQHSENVEILLDRDEILQVGGDSKKLAVVSDVAVVSQDDFLLIHFSHFEILKQTISCNLLYINYVNKSWMIKDQLLIRLR